LLVEAYGEDVLNNVTYRFGRFKSSDFAVEDKECAGRPKLVEDAGLETLLDEDPCQMQKEFAESLKVAQSTISMRLKALVMIQKQGNWVPVVWIEAKKPGKTFFHNEQLLQWQKRKGFLHRIVTGDEKWIYYDNPKRKKLWSKPGHASTSTAKPNIYGSKLMLFI